MTSPRRLCDRVLPTLLAAVIVLTGCAAQPAAGPTGAPTVATPSPTPTPRPGPTADAAPVYAYDGDCANVFEDPTVLAGAELWTPLPGPTGIGTLGGLRCVWVAGDDMQYSLSLDALPVSEVPADLGSAYADTVCLPELGLWVCHLAGSAAGTWVHVSAPAGEGQAPMTPDLSPILAAALTGASAWPHPRASVAPPERWAPVDCEQLDAAADIAAVFAPVPYAPGYGHGPSDHLHGALSAVEQWCGWHAPDSGVGISMSLLPGAGSRWPQALPEGASPAQVEGAAGAFTAVGDAGEVLFATDGENVLTIWESMVPAADLAARVLAALG